MKGFLTSSIFFVSTALHAQISFGPAAAIQYSTCVGGYSYIKYQWEYGYQAGGFVLFPFKENDFFQSGLIVNSEAYKYQYTQSFNDGSASSTAYLHVAYLQIPLLCRKAFSNGMHLEGGGFVSYQISQHSGETTYYESLIDSFVMISQSASEDYNITGNRWQVGLAAGFGYLKSGFDLSLNSQYHLTSLFDMTDANYQKQHLFALSLALAYHIRQKER